MTRRLQVGDEYVDPTADKSRAHGWHLALPADDSPASIRLTQLLEADADREVVERGFHRCSVSVDVAHADLSNGTCGLHLGELLGGEEVAARLERLGRLNAADREQRQVEVIKHVERMTRVAVLSKQSCRNLTRRHNARRAKEDGLGTKQAGQLLGGTRCLMLTFRRTQITNHFHNRTCTKVQRHQGIDRRSQSATPRRPAHSPGLNADLTKDRGCGDSNISQHVDLVFTGRFDNVRFVQPVGLLKALFKFGVNMERNRDDGAHDASILSLLEES